MKRHVDTRPPAPYQQAGEDHCEIARVMFGDGIGLDTCKHDGDKHPCCHGGHGRHLAIPRHPVRRPSSSQAGLASFRDVWAGDPDRTTRRETYR